MRCNCVILLSIATAFSVLAKSKSHGPKNILAGYIPGSAGMPLINETNCENDVLIEHPYLSNALECARTCHAGDRPKHCYYHFVIERYTVLGPACNLCTPDVANSICANCQCVPGDGVDRMTFTVNRMIPGPSIQVCLGDYVTIDVENRIKDDAITLHWHGLFQKDYQYYDGVPNLTQCPILYTNTFRYRFQVKNSGTHFWHAHTGLNKMDGVFGSLIVRDPIETDPNKKYYNTDFANHVVTVNDWMNEESTGRYPGRSTGVTGQLPDSLLINGKGRFTDSNGSTTNTSLEVITVEANKLHRFRVINAFCTVCAGQLTIENHNFTVLAIDGQYIKPVVVNSIVSLAGERYDFVINTNQAPGAYWIQLRAIGLCGSNKIQQLGILQYLGASNNPTTPEPSYDDGLPTGIVLNPVDSACDVPNPERICISELEYALPDDNDIGKPEADVKFYLPIHFRDFTVEEAFQPNRYRDFSIPVPGIINAAMIDNIGFKFPVAPPLSQLWDLPPNEFCNSENLPKGCNNTCKCTHMLKIPLHAIVEIVLVDMTNAPNLTHPFHLHGYAFRVVSMGQPLGPSGNSTISVDYVKELEKNGTLRKNLDSPAGKDTIIVPNNGYTVFRFRASNPGYWLFHCHFIYHQLIGMEVILNVGKQSQLPPVPQNFPKCGNFMPSFHFEEETTKPSDYARGRGKGKERQRVRKAVREYGMTNE